MAVPEVTTGVDIILAKTVLGNAPAESGTYTASLTATATNAPTGYTWTMIGYPVGSSAPDSGDFIAGVANVQNPQFEADKRGTYVCRCVAVNGDGPSDPEVDDLNAQQLVKIASWLTDSYIPSKGQLDYPDELNEVLYNIEDKAARVPDFLNIKNYGAVGTGVADDSNAFVLAMAASAVTGEIIDLPPGSYKLNTTMTLTAASTFRFQPGSKIIPASGHTITANCRVIAGPWQIFDVQGTLDASGLIVDVIHASWFGVDVSESAANNVANMNIMFDSIGDNRRVSFLSGIYPTNAQVLAGNNYLSLQSADEGLVTFSVTPSADMTALKFERAAGAEIMYGLRMNGFRFTSADTARKKIAVQCVKNTGTRLDNVGTVNAGWDNTVGTCIGLEVDGVDEFAASECDFNSSVPINISNNNTHGTMRFTNKKLRSTNNFGACINVEDQAQFLSIICDGYQRWYEGQDGFRFIDTTGTVEVGHIRIQNVVHTNERTSAGYTITVAHAQGIKSLVCDDVVSTGDNDNNGFKIHDVETATLRDCQHKDATGVALDVDNVATLVLSNTRFEPGATITMAGMMQMFESSREASQDLSATAIYVKDTVDGPFTWQQGVAQWRGTFTMADGGTYDLPIGAAAYLAAKVSAVIVDTVGQGTGEEEMGIWVVTRASVSADDEAIVAGTPKIKSMNGAGPVLDNFFTLWRVDNTTVRLANELNANMTVMVTIDFIV